MDAMQFPFEKWPIMVQAFVVHYIEPYYSYYTEYTLLLLLTQTKSQKWNLLLNTECHGIWQNLNQ